jgi:hypothetical protein
VRCLFCSQLTALIRRRPRRERGRTENQTPLECQRLSHRKPDPTRQCPDNATYKLLPGLSAGLEYNPRADMVSQQGLSPERSYPSY